MQFCFIFTDPHPEQYFKLTHFWGFYESSITFHPSPFPWPSIENLHHQGEEAPPSPPGAWTCHQLEQCWNQACWPLVSFIPFFLSFISSHLVIQNPLWHPYTVAQGLTYQIPSVWFTTKTWWGFADPDVCHSFQSWVFMNLGSSFHLKGGTSHHGISLRDHLNLKCYKNHRTSLQHCWLLDWLHNDCCNACVLLFSNIKVK